MPRERFSSLLFAGIWRKQLLVDKRKARDRESFSPKQTFVKREKIYVQYKRLAERAEEKAVTSLANKLANLKGIVANVVSISRSPHFERT